MSNLIDLTLSYQTGMAGFDQKSAKTVAKDGWNASTLTFYSHAGTHMDAPFHFGVSEQTIDEWPVDRFRSKAHVIQLTGIGHKGLIYPKDLGAVQTIFQAGESLLLHTGWSQYALDDPATYRNELPRISEALAHWCVERQVNVLGVEPPSVADVNDMEEVTRIHHILLGGNVIIVEGLTNLDQLEQDQVELIALPLKIKGCDGAPARVVALTD